MDQRFQLSVRIRAKADLLFRQRPTADQSVNAFARQDEPHWAPAKLRGGGGKNMMIGNFIELQFGQGRNWPLGAALSIALLLVVMIALIFYIRVANKGSNPHG